MAPYRFLMASRHRRLVTALALAMAACQRREGIEPKTLLNLGTNEDWQLATHPALSLSADQLRDLTVKLFEGTNRFQLVSSKKSGTPSAKAITRVVSVDTEPAPDQLSRDLVRVRVRLEYVPAGADEDQAFIALASGLGQGPRDQAETSACKMALARAVEQITLELQAGTKSAEELVADLSAADPYRTSAALKHLAARRHPSAFQPLLRQLHTEDEDASLEALSSLVSYDDPRAVGPIIDEAEHRDFAFYLEALYAIGSLGGEQAEAYLETIQGGHTDPRVQTAAAEALRLVRKRATTTRPTRNPAPEVPSR